MPKDLVEDSIDLNLVKNANGAQIWVLKKSPPGQKSLARRWTENFFQLFKRGFSEKQPTKWIKKSNQIVPKDLVEDSIDLNLVKNADGAQIWALKKSLPLQKSEFCLIFM